MQLTQVNVHSDHRSQMQQRMQLHFSGRNEGLRKPKNSSPHGESQEPWFSPLDRKASICKHQEVSEMGHQLVKHANATRLCGVEEYAQDRHCQKYVVVGSAFEIVGMHHDGGE